jgi:heat shock protein HtpX
MKRIILFVLTNLAVVLVLGVVASLLGVNRFLTSNGLDLTALLGFALIMGFGGAFISLLISKPVAKWSSGVQVIAQPSNADEKWLVDTVKKLADKSGIGMPEVSFQATLTLLQLVHLRTLHWLQSLPACCKT